MTMSRTMLGPGMDGHDIDSSNDESVSINDDHENSFHSISGTSESEQEVF